MGVRSWALWAARTAVGAYALLIGATWYAVKVGSGRLPAARPPVALLALLFAVGGWWLLFRGVPGEARRLWA